MKPKGLFFLAMASALLTGLSACSLDEVLLEGETGDGSVSFKVVAGNATRTSATTTNNIKSFSVWAWNDSNEFMDCVTAIKGDNGTFTTSPLYFWPNGTVDFYALSPTAMGYAVDTGVEYAYLGGEITIDENDEGGEHWSYTGNVARATIAEDNISIDAYIPGSAEDQIDLCYAVAKEYDSTCGSVPMNFRHALSQIVFKAKDANEDFTVDVAGVSVCSVYKQGTYVLKGVPSTTDHLDEGDSTSPVSSSQGEWSTESHKARYAAGVTAQTLPTNGETVTLTSEGGALMLLPQTVEAWDPDSDPTDTGLGAYIRILCHVEEHGSVLWPTDAEEENGAITVGEDGKDYAEIAVPVDIEWEEGYRYTYTIIFGNGLGYYLPDDPNADLDGTPVLKIITFEVSVDEFQNAEDVYVHTDTECTPISFSEMRENYATGEPIEDYVSISGIVVSNKEQGNAGQPVHTTAGNATDFSLLKRTVYFESEDAKYGIVIICDEEDDNIFDQFDRVTLKLMGATLTKKFDTEDRSNYCPISYELTGFKPSMVADQTAGEDAPVKERTIATLTDDDMYTYVKLKDVEFPIRMGCLFNADGGFYSASISDATSNTTKYPTLVRGKDGGSLYLLTNDHCLYHRDGTHIPYGSGSISGVIVHEHFSRFEWEAGYSNIFSDIVACETKGSLGNIGKYQIRHQTRDDVYSDMSTDFGDDFSKLICEYRWRVIEATTGDLKNLGDSIDVPSYGTNGWFTHTYQTYFTGSSSANYTYNGSGSGIAGNTAHFCAEGGSYVYVGPVGTSDSRFYGSNKGNRNGIGIVVDEKNENIQYQRDRFAINRDGEMELACDLATNGYCGYGDKGWTESGYADKINVPNCYGSTDNAGKGACRTEMQICYANQYSWTNGEPYGFLLYFSTKDITSDNVSLQFTIRGDVANGGQPRYWIVEYALPETELVPDLSSLEWTPAGNFTITDKVNTSASNKVWQLMAFKELNFNLPTTILNNEHVYVRIRPASGIKGSSSDYEDGEASGTQKVIIQYLAVRCNK